MKPGGFKEKGQGKMASTITMTSKKAVRTSTNRLKAGDVVQHGNCVHGFWYTTIASVQPSDYSKNMMAVSETFEHGGTDKSYYGKNAIWYVVSEAK